MYASGFRFSAGVVRRIIQIATLLAVQAALLFACAGRVDWLTGWVYLGVFLCNIGLNLLFLVPKGAAATALIEERARVVPEKIWDRGVSAVLAVAHLTMLAVAGLDERFRWSPVLGWRVQILGLLAMAIGLAVASWAMLTNTYFSSIVRIQPERGQRVVTDGPYQHVRHPGYAGFIIFSGATPLLLGSLWALVPASILIGAIVLRTWLEDRTLRMELEGYCEYSKHVTYRLIPGLW